MLSKVPESVYLNSIQIDTQMLLTFGCFMKHLLLESCKCIGFGGLFVIKPDFNVCQDLLLFLLQLFRANYHGDKSSLYVPRSFSLILNKLLPL